ncbi:hypothetical protein [Photorhabdus luminescens]|uniref:hypothetical protein n=1 Tax=Photorhabdus luminescens TaxID=29488 RepID=UPI001C40368E|nr:hypothetical protein [Photorhabdus luminescens]
MQEESINIPKPDNAELSVTNELIENSSIAMSSIVSVTNKPAVSRNLDGRLEVFVRGADNALWHIWQTTPNSGWSDWQSLGNTITSNPAVYANADGRLEVFVRGADYQCKCKSLSFWYVTGNCFPLPITFCYQ